MEFQVAAEIYDRFMGRYSTMLSPQMADFAGVGAGQRALDVGSGPGALTAELVTRLGADAVTAVDPSPSFVEAARARNPGVTVHQASAEQLPLDDESFDVVLAQLVVHFMPDPVAGLSEMRRVTRPGGVVAACVWDFAGGQAPLSVMWRATRELGHVTDDESQRPGAREGHLEELFESAGLREVRGTAMPVSLEHPTFEDWWQPYTTGVGPAGAFIRDLSDEQREQVRDRCRELLPQAPFVLTARAWAARGVA